MALAFVRHSDGGTVDNGSTVVATAAQTLTAGNLLVVGVRGATNDLNSCSDTAGNTFTALTQYFPASGVAMRIFYVANCLGHASNIVTVTGTLWYKAISADEFSGAALASVIDAEVGGNHASGTTLSSPALTTTNAADLVVVYGSQGSAATTYTAGSGYTIIDGTIGVGAEFFLGAEYKIVSSVISGVAQTIVSNVTNAGTIAVASFKEAAPGGILRQMMMHQ